ncbi:hypothetical protein [Catenulispora yoronensis]|uniref:hypothetical protein n=1 Tax=Catenulispora yoronensis TaxID=450799 RepID=UPI0031E03BBB
MKGWASIRYSRALAMSVIVVAAIAACGGGDDYHAYGKPVSESEIQGSWTSDCGATMRLQPDGSAQVAGFPLRGDLVAQYSGTARWNLYKGAGWTSVTDPPAVEVAADSTFESLKLAQVKGRFGLAAQIGHVDHERYCHFSRQ